MNNKLRFPLTIAITLFGILYMLLLITGCTQTKKEEPESAPAYTLLHQTFPSNFSGDSAFTKTKMQVAFGPRVPNTTAHELCADYIIREAKKYAGKVDIQQFAYPGYDGIELKLTNIIARINPEKTNRVLLLAHWDSRPRADEETDAAKKTQPIPGANDGASGVAVMLELLRTLEPGKLNYGIDLLFTDGEDYGKSSDLQNYCLGTKYFAANKGEYRPAFGILLDMVGDTEAKFFIEDNSYRSAEDVAKMIWQSAEEANAVVFVNENKYSIYDDHVPLIQAGIRTVDIIDAELVGYQDKAARRGYWHTTRDEMKNISASVLQQTGDVLTRFFYNLQFK